MKGKCKCDFCEEKQTFKLKKNWIARTEFANSREAFLRCASWQSLQLFDLSWYFFSTDPILDLFGEPCLA